MGEPPYTGGSAQAVLAKILMGDAPAPTTTRASIPANVDAAIRKSLEKLPADRFTAIQDFSKGLADPGFRHGGLAVAGATASTNPWNRLTVGFAGVAAVLALGLGWSLLRPEPSQPVSRQVLNTDGWLGLDGPLLEVAVALAPDGSSMILPVESSTGGVQFALKMRGSTEITPIAGTEGGQSVVYSPDGRWIAYRVGPELFKRRLVGGAR